MEVSCRCAAEDKNWKNAVSMDRVYTSLIGSNDPPPSAPTKKETLTKQSQPIFLIPYRHVSVIFFPFFYLSHTPLSTLIRFPFCFSDRHCHPIGALKFLLPLVSLEFFSGECCRFTWKWWNNTSSIVFHQRPCSTKGKKLSQLNNSRSVCSLKFVY